mmetsp:Transcript_149026/g.477281  ORF Transcript_149026/g.477281 Transcript_149026/m.477281 type:complete len:203 (+) Transcript_149026:144-752(+)
MLRPTSWGACGAGWSGEWVRGAPAAPCCASPARPMPSPRGSRCCWGGRQGSSTPRATSPSAPPPAPGPSPTTPCAGLAAGPRSMRSPWARRRAPCGSIASAPGRCACPWRQSCRSWAVASRPRAPSPCSWRPSPPQSRLPRPGTVLPKRALRGRAVPRTRRTSPRRLRWCAWSRTHPPRSPLGMCSSPTHSRGSSSRSLTVR